MLAAAVFHLQQTTTRANSMLHNKDKAPIYSILCPAALRGCPACATAGALRQQRHNKPTNRSGAATGVVKCSLLVVYTEASIINIKLILLHKLFFSQGLITIVFSLLGFKLWESTSCLCIKFQKNKNLSNLLRNKKQYYKDKSKMH